jgi:hypothetical protein
VWCVDYIPLPLAHNRCWIDTFSFHSTFSNNPPIYLYPNMSRGDQRERDRAKNLAKNANKGTTQREGRPADRNASDAVKLAAKVAAKQAQKEEEAANGGGGDAAAAKVVPKKVTKPKDAGLNDLLDAGLGAKKKGK